MYLGSRAGRFSISGELSCRRIMSTRCGRTGISWTLRQRVGQTFQLRHKISGPNSWKRTILIRSNLTPNCARGLSLREPINTSLVVCRCALWVAGSTGRCKRTSGLTFRIGDRHFYIERLLALVRLAVLLRVTYPLVVALDLHIDVGIVRALVRRTGADLDEHGVAIGTIDQAVTIRHACLPGSRVT